MRMQRKIPLAGNGRRYFDIRRFLGPQAVAKGVEDLSIVESSIAGSVVGRQVLGASGEWSDLEELNVEHRAPGAIEPSKGRRIVAAPVTITAGVTGDEEADVRDLILSRLIRLHAAAGAPAGRQGWAWRSTRDCSSQPEERNNEPWIPLGTSHRVSLLVEIHLASNFRFALLRSLLRGSGERRRRIAAAFLDGVGAGPEVRRSLAVQHPIAHRLQSVLQIRGDRIELFVAHVTEGDPWHRRRQVSGPRRKISLPWCHRSDLDIRCLARTQPVPQCVEDLPLAESAETGRVVRRQIARAGLEWADLKRGGCVGETGEKTRIRRSGYADTMAIGTAVIENQLAAAQHLLLLGGDTVSTGIGRRTRRRATRDQEQGAQERLRVQRAQGGPSFHVSLALNWFYLTSSTPIMPWSS